MFITCSQDILGGTEKLANLVLLHRNCHMQVHYG